MVRYSTQYYSNKQEIDAGKRSPLLSLCRFQIGGFIMLKGVRLVSIPVRDQNKALDVYTEKLGLSILTDQPFDGKQRWIELSLPGSDTLLALYTPKGQEDRIGTFSNIAVYRD